MVEKDRYLPQFPCGLRGSDSRLVYNTSIERVNIHSNVVLEIISLSGIFFGATGHSSLPSNGSDFTVLVYLYNAASEN